MEHLHMRVGQNIGEIILDIAQNNIIKGKPEKAITTYTDSFHGFTKEYALMCLKNKAVLLAEEDGEGVRLTDWENEIKANADFIIDWNKHIKTKIVYLKELIETIQLCKDKFISNYHGDINDYNITEMMKRYMTEEQLSFHGQHNIAAKLIAGGSFDKKLYSNGEGHWDRLCDHVEYDNSEGWERVLYWTVKYVENIKTLHKEILAFLKTYHFLVDEGFIEEVPKIRDMFEHIFEILVKFSDINKGYYHGMCDDKLYEYKENLYGDILHTVEGKEYLQNGILTRNIMDGYDGGWLSPDGEFYGSDGETSSMIHMRLAEQIFNGNNVYANRMAKDGVSVWSGIDSPDYWLEKHGWVKIHHDDCYGAFIGERNPEDRTPDFPYHYCPTEIQIKMICDYADKFYAKKFYTEANAFGRDKHPNPYTTYAVRQMDDIKLHEIFGR